MNVLLLAIGAAVLLYVCYRGIIAIIGEKDEG